MPRPRVRRRLLFAGWLAAAVLLAAQSNSGSLTVLSREGRRTLPLTAIGAHDYVALDDIVEAFGATLRDDRLAGGVTLTVAGRTILLTPDQAVVSVAGRLVSLPAPVVRQDARWLVPVEFLPNALGPASNVRYDLRRASRLLVVGDLRVPRVTVRVEGGANGTTITLDSTPPTPARLQPGAGLIDVQFEADGLDLNIPAVTPQPLLQALAAEPMPGVLRIVTGPRFVTHRVLPTHVADGSSRLTLELLSQTTAEVLPPPPLSGPVPPAAPPALVPPPPGPRTVVIDPGHGGDEQGAVGARGTREKDVTLAVAGRLRTLIESRLGLRVLLTREDDRAVSLDGRTAFANNQKADVFLSLHANSAPRPTLRGAEVYSLRVEGSALASPEPSGASSVVVSALGGGTRSLDLIPWDTAQERYAERSSLFAGTVRSALGARVKVSPRELQQVPLRVLVGANMPAVLVEMGYLSHPEEEAAMASAAHQDRLAEALFDAITRLRGVTDQEGPPMPRDMVPR